MSDPQLLFGTFAPLPDRRTLTAGALEAVLENGQLRHIRWHGREAIRGIAFLVRDVNWGTYEVAPSSLEIEEKPAGFTVAYRAVCGDQKQRLGYAVRITADAAGSLTFAATMRPDTDFATNRAGFVVLHPLEGVAGNAVTVTHTDGTVERAQFPKHVAPNQPLFDLRSVQHEVSPGALCTCTMEGDAFEMEDQRNWTDASFKTYVRPLSKPFPYTLPAGRTVEQSVTLRFEQSGAEPIAIEVAPSASVVALASGYEGALPALGLALDPREDDEGCHDLRLGPEALQALKALAPQWLVGRVTAANPDATWQALAEAAAAGRSRVWLEAVVDGLDDLAELGAHVQRAGLEVGAVAVSPSALLKTVPSGFSVPGLPSLAPLWQAARKAFPQARIGGGSLAYFTELNRNPPSPADALDFITHSTCPIIHAADDLSVMETLEALPWVFESTRHLANRAAYWLAPTALGMRFNPYGAGPAANPTLERRAMAKVDPRQRGLFGAAFYMAYAALAARAALSQVTLSAVTGPHGVLPGSPLPALTPGARVHPAFVALRWLARGAGKPRIPLDVRGPRGIEAVAYADGSTAVLLLANLTPEARSVEVSDAQDLWVHVLDEGTCAEALADLTWGDGEGRFVAKSVQLAPYAIARVRLQRR